MSRERVSRDGRPRTLHPEERREPESSSSELTPELVDHLQRSAGNAAVGRLLRLRTKAQFKSDSKLKSGLITLPRSTELEGVDDALEDYELAQATGDLLACQRVLWDLGSAIQGWKKSKATGDDDQAYKGAKRADEIDALFAEYKTELDAVEQAMRDEDGAQQVRLAASRQDRMDQLLTTSIKALTDPVAKAKAVFAVFMNEFRGTAGYRTTTGKDVSIWDGGSYVACGMISQGLIELLRSAGLTAKKRTIATKNFVTKRLDASFIDPTAEGNVRLPGGVFADERRYFFNMHVIVEVADGALYLDPTSGCEVSADAAEIVEFSGLASDNGGPPSYSDATRVLAPAGKNSRGDGAYELRSAVSTEDETESSSGDETTGSSSETS